MPEKDNDSSSRSDAVPDPQPTCVNPLLGNQIAEYCFGDMQEQKRQEVEAHLLECSVCWQEVHRLDASVRVLRADRSLMRTILTPKALGLIGLSGKFDHRFAGHSWHAAGASMLYSLLYAISLVFEVAYQFDVYGVTTTTAATFLVFPWVWGTTLAALFADVAVTRRGKNSGLAWSFLVLCAATAILLAGTWLVLPNHPITLLQIQAYPAQAAYFKNTLYYFPLCLVFVLTPFHFVLMMQRQLREGRHRRVFAVLTGGSMGVTPKGSVFLRVWHLSVILGFAGLASLYLTSRLMDNLMPAPYMNLFVSLIQLRTFLYFALAVGCLVWYSRALDEIKRECITVLQVSH